jgi:hypothetical protein
MSSLTLRYIDKLTTEINPPAKTQIIHKVLEKRSFSPLGTEEESEEKIGNLNIPLIPSNKPNPKVAPYLPAYESHRKIETKNPTKLNTKVTKDRRRD